MDKTEASAQSTESTNEELCINAQRVYDSCSSKENTRYQQIFTHRIKVVGKNNSYGKSDYV